MRLLGTAVVTVAVASFLWASTKVVGQAVRSAEHRDLTGLWELVSLQDTQADGEAPTNDIRDALAGYYAHAHLAASRALLASSK